MGAVFATPAPKADKLPPNLVKISKDTNPNCIDFVSYKGELYCSIVPIDTTPSDVVDFILRKAAASM